MSLVTFHRGLILAAIVFCFGYGLREIAGAGEAPLLGLVFMGLGAGFVYYLARLERFLGRGREGARGGRG